jgi:hypothetical protein
MALIRMPLTSLTIGASTSSMPFSSNSFDDLDGVDGAGHELVEVIDVDDRARCPSPRSPRRVFVGEA